MVSVVVVSVVAVVDEEPVAPIELPLGLVLVLELSLGLVLLVLELGLVLPLVLPLAPMLPVAPEGVPLFAGVPVLPIGVVCVLCWPAPTAGSLAAAFGGLLCAIAEPAMAMAARPASTPLIWVDAVISENP